MLRQLLSIVVDISKDEVGGAPLCGGYECRRGIESIKESPDVFDPGRSEWKTQTFSLIVVEYDIAVVFVQIVGEFQKEIDISWVKEARGCRGGCVKSSN